MDAAYIVTWSRPTTGREDKAMEYALAVAEHWSKAAANGQCTEPE